MFKPAPKRSRGHFHPQRGSESLAMSNISNIYISKIPRRYRFLVMVFAIFCITMLLPIPSNLSPRRIVAMLLTAFVLPESTAGTAYVSGQAAQKPDILQYVDPLIGTVNGGHVFPGASLPYGMAKPVADTDSHGENAAGYVSDYSLVRGFSHMHDSGTGGSPSMGNFPLFLHPGCPDDDLERCVYTVTKRSIQRVNDSAKASPGYFALGLTNGIHAEITATQHAALYRFTVPEDAEIENNGIRTINSPTMLVDLIDLANTRSNGSVQVDPDTGRVMGNGTYSPSFGRGHYQAYFCADFRGATIRATGTFIDEKPDTEIKNLTGVGSGYYSPSGSVGAFVQFSQPQEGNQIFARVGLSFMSSEKACMNAEKEVPDFDFDLTRERAREAWREKLSVVETDSEGMSDDLQTTFWSGLYRAMLSPQDYTGENPLWDSGEPYYDSFYCIWDSFRAQHPLLTILDPEEQTRMVRSLVDIYRHEGKLPDCRMTFSRGYVQGGSNADVVIVDALLKNITKGIDWALAYAAVLSDAEVEPKDWSIEGRGGLESWHSIGYIPYADHDKLGTGPMSRTVSRTVEYAYDDFCIAIMADIMDQKEDHEKYLARSNNWKNVWNPEQKDLFRNMETGHVDSTDFVGFMQPRLANGTWKYQNTRMCSPIYQQHLCYFDTVLDTYEGSPWLYSFFVPQDMKTLISTMGGRDAFVTRLNYFHESGIIYMGNEQSFLPVYQFHYAGRPGMSSYWTHQYIPSQFNSSVNGIPGNDDCAMGAFTTFAFLGFFPVAGQDVYLLTPPMFHQVSIKTPSGRPAIIRNRNHDPSYRKIYIQSATLDGKPYLSNWITHKFFIEGGVLEFVLGETEGGWGVAEESVPPSSSEYL